MKLTLLRVLLPCALIAGFFVGVPSTPATADETPVPATPDAQKPTSSDFNGDGIADLASGKANANAAAGLVIVTYGTANGLEDSSSQVLRQGVGGLAGTSTAGDEMGDALAWGDFDRDGYDDLAIGIPHDTVAAIQPGSVIVVYGRASGLDLANSRMFTSDSPGVPGVAQNGDAFGTTLAAGDFGNGPQDDLAIAATGKDAGGVFLSGAVTVLYGRPSGLSGKGARELSMATKGVKGSPTDNGFFGRDALAAGDFDGDGYDDLAAGDEGEDVGGLSHPGALHVFYGSAHGLQVAGNQRFVQGSRGIDDTLEANDRFGSAVAVGDFGRTTHDDLAVSATAEDNEDAGVSGAGSVFVLYGSPRGLRGAHSKQMWIGAGGIPGTPAGNDFFGTVLAAGDLGSSKQADLVIGAPDVGTGGVVFVVEGSPRGIRPQTAEVWTQDTAGVWDSVESGDYFGNALAIANFGSSPRKDLAAGVHSEDFPGFANAGAIHVFFGSPDGPVSTGNEFLYEGNAGFPGPMTASGFLPDALA